MNKITRKTPFFLLLGVSILTAQVQAQPPVHFAIEKAGSTDFSSKQDIFSMLALGSVTAGFVTYLVDSYMVKEEFLVESAYPNAQKWYEDLGKKYPEAHLESKRFLQQSYIFSKKHISWSSSINAIYFPQDSLKDINYLYGKKLEGGTLTEQEDRLLAKYEFIILHEAGHIEQHHIFKRIGANVVMLASASYLYNFLRQRGWFGRNEGGGLLTCAAWLSVFAHAYSRFTEGQADDFACDYAGIEELQGGIDFFEDESIDPLARVQGKKVTPFIETDSVIGKGIQKTLLGYEWLKLKIKQCVARSLVLRWLYDAPLYSTHPRPLNRAHKLRKVLAQKKHK